MDKTISNKIKYMYFILTIGMVMYHSRGTWYYNIHFENKFDKFLLHRYIEFADHIGFICMVFFFFMSAFWFYYKLDNYSDIINKWKKRFKTLFIPFLLWTLILGVYKVQIGEIVVNKSNIFYHVFETPITGTLWYILAVLILQMFAPIVVFMKKKKKFIMPLFILISIYIVLRNFGFIPHLLSFPKCWWWNNMIDYTPVYLLGAYIGIFYSDAVLKNKYLEKKYTYIGIVLLFISCILWHYFNQMRFSVLMIYSLIELIGFWFVFKPSICKKMLPKFLDCGFYVFVLHGPILLPHTKTIIVKLLDGVAIAGYEVILVKIVQLLLVLLLSALIKFLSSKILSKPINYYLTGGR